MPSNVALREVVRLFKRHGWWLERVRGSHRVFKSPTGRTYPVPVHHGTVTYVYYHDIKKFLGEG